MLVNFDTHPLRIDFFLNRFISSVHDDFEEGSNTLEGLCDLKENLSFERGTNPDYDIQLVQQAYLLRYGAAYFAEYYRIYRQLLENVGFDWPLDVVSFGCGCGIDCWGFKFALDGCELTDHGYRYLGVDIVDWAYRNFHQDIKCPSEGEVHFINHDITNTDKHIRATRDTIFIFPKSIGEVSDNFDDLKQMIAESKFKCDRLCLVSSHRETYETADAAKIEAIASIIAENHGYHEVARFSHEDVIEAGKRGILKYVPGCCYPDNVKDKVGDFRNYCQRYLTPVLPFQHDPSCARKLRRTPMLTVDHWRWLSIVLDRDE